MSEVEQTAASTTAPPAVVENQEPTAEATGAAVEAPKAATPESAFEALRKPDGFKQVGKATEAKADEAATDDDTATEQTEPTKAKPTESAPAKQAKPKNAVDGDERLTRQIQEKLTERKRLVQENQQLQAQNEQLKTAAASGKPAASPTRESATAQNGKPVRPNLEAVAKEVGEEKAWATYEDRLADYEEKLTDWKVEQRESKQSLAKQQEYTDQLVADAIAKHGDFEDVAFADDLKVSDTMAAYLFKQGEVGMEMLYHLGSNKAEAAKIAKMTQLDQIEALVGLKQQFAKKGGAKEGTQNGAAKKFSQASPPPDQINGTNGTPLDPIKAALAKDGTPEQKFGRFRAATEAARAKK